MIELDNTKLILDRLKFPDNDTYYYLQILQREGEPKVQRYSTLVTKEKGIDIEEIKHLCRFFIGRAYISIIPRSLKKFTLELLNRVTERVKNECYVPSIFGISNSVAVSPKTIISKGSLWLFDVDCPDFKDPILKKCEDLGIEVDSVIPSFQGYHIIVKPFNPKILSETGSEVIYLENDVTFSIKKEANTMIFGIKS